MRTLCPEVPRRDPFGLNLPKESLEFPETWTNESLAAVQCPKACIQPSVSRFPGNPEIARAAGLPLGLAIQCMAEEVPLVDEDLIRCHQCRAFTNPFTRFTNDQKWECVFCKTATNGVPFGFKREKLESLKQGGLRLLVEAPLTPPAFLFLIESTYASSKSGFLGAVTASLRARIPELPAQTLVGFMSFGEDIQVYAGNKSKSAPYLLVVPPELPVFPVDTETPFFGVGQHGKLISKILDHLESRHYEEQDYQSCLGSALLTAARCIRQTPVACLAFVSGPPNVGQAQVPERAPQLEPNDRLRPRGNLGPLTHRGLIPYMMGVSMIVGTREPFIDLVSIAEAVSHSGGTLHYMEKFSRKTHQEALSLTLKHILARETGYNAFLRIRISRGWQISQVHGHLKPINDSLLCLGTCYTDQTIYVNCQLDPQLQNFVEPFVYVQTSLFYTDAEGCRIFRLNTRAILTTGVIKEYLGSLNPEVGLSLLVQNALRIPTLSDCQKEIQKIIKQILLEAQHNQALCPKFWKLGLYAMSLLKSLAFRGLLETSMDYRSYLRVRLWQLPVNQLVLFVYPQLIRLDSGEGRFFSAPPIGQSLPLSVKSLEAKGTYALNNGESLYVMGTEADHWTESPNVSQIGERPANTWVNSCTLTEGCPKSWVNLLVEDPLLGFELSFAEFLQRMGIRL